MARNRKSIIKSLLKGLFTAILITLIAMLLLSAALIYLGISDRLLVICNQLIKFISIIIGTMAAVPRGSERGLASGVLLALAYTAGGYALYLALGGGSFAIGNMLGEMLLGCAAGAVTGAIRANMKPRGRTRAAKPV